ncbi:hypothetical protein ABZ712_33695 [Streptomyces sp. NPDC006906]|uniref:hypothetical protein n=1 Tax=unclassified Streptomyces TaxID=2593676 RepID=UPI0033DFCB26
MERAAAVRSLEQDQTELFTWPQIAVASQGQGEAVLGVGERLYQFCPAQAGVGKVVQLQDPP